MAAATRQSYSRAAIAKLIKKAWPGGIVDMPIDEDESYFWDIYDKLRAKISKLPGASTLDESWPSPQISSIDDDDDDDDGTGLARCRRNRAVPTIYSRFGLKPESNFQ